jgi:hypothetical protein
MVLRFVRVHHWMADALTAKETVLNTTTPHFLTD